MTNRISHIKWKCRRGLRELDLLLREMISQHLENFDLNELDELEGVLKHDDQSLFDFIFKDVPLGNKSHELFILKYIKTYKKD